MIDGALCEANALSGEIKIENTIIAGHTNDFEVAIGSTFDAMAWFTTPSFNNIIFDLSSDVMLTDAYNITSPNFLPTAASPLLNGASFAASELSGFETVSFRGAFGNLNWTLCWANWDPQNTNYGEVPGTIAQAIASFTVSNVDLAVTFTNTSSNAVSYMWDFGDLTTTADTSSEANPTYTYPELGSYNVTLTAIGTCADVDSLNQSLDLSVGVVNMENINTITMFPNPAKNIVSINVNATEDFDAIISVTDITGRNVLSTINKKMSGGNNFLSINTVALQSGVYYVTISNGKEQTTNKLIIAK